MGLCWWRGGEMLVARAKELEDRNPGQQVEKRGSRLFPNGATGQPGVSGLGVVGVLSGSFGGLTYSAGISPVNDLSQMTMDWT